MNEFTIPEIAYLELLPLLIVFGGAIVGVGVEAFVGRSARRTVEIALTSATLVAALVACIWVGGRLPVVEHGGTATARGLLTAGDTLAIDGPTVFLWGLVLLISLAGVLLFAERKVSAGLPAFAGQAAATPGSRAEREADALGLEHTEVYPLMLFAVAGMMMFPAANDLLVMFVALEVLSLPLYLLTGLARRRRMLSQEAAMKYFLLGAFASGFFLYGAALTYGYAGSMKFAQINEAVRNSEGNGLLLLGIGLLCVGLLFKVGAVPFHQWTPDVYQGAPTAVTAWMAAGTKVAAIGALLRLLHVAFGSAAWSWQPMLWVIALATMAAGAVLAIAQTDVKRMLAYSSIAHAGFMLAGVLGFQSAADLAPGQLSATQAVLFYLVAYGFAVLAAFALVGLVRDASGEVTELARWAGIGKESPLLAGAFAFLLLAMAGIPLTSGFIGKWAVFSVAGAAGAWPIVVAGVLFSVVAAFFYVRVIMLMFFTEPTGTAAVVRPSWATTAAISAGVAVTVVLGVLPGPVLELAAHAGEFLR
ncbi:NADH-quinone oxidoreductase subunit NuoN [Nocardioides limicola]|uniref:NADH-quinone oxidoreductase subunit NuoN n=1 Tax=Nocardioides limicola TaxID=2803368 RepID=UPI00193B6829|nr:NADH-quinone oxidoreductase subunit NuoN [Nocardioides sp. DJM-14]